MKIITEGKAKIYASVADDNKISKALDVFYNPVMKFNRDISVLFLNSCGLENISVCDLLAGSGVRSIRFLKELNAGIIKDLCINDYKSNFTRNFGKSLELNDLQMTANTPNLYISEEDANMFMLKSKGFDYIEIDPFGSPNDFLDSSIVRLSRRGILAVTATDTAPLSGTYSDACMRKYWAKPIRNYLMHEIGLRILIRKIQLVGAQYDKALIPQISYFKDHYFRIFFKCVKSKTEVDKLIKNHKYFLYCSKCMFHSVSLVNSLECPNCKSECQFAGPIYSGNILDNLLIEKMLKNSSSTEFTECEKYLKLFLDESKLNVVGFYNIHELSSILKFKVTSKTSNIIEKIKKKGNSAIQTHFDKLSIKTDMPLKELIELLKKIYE